MQNIFKYVDRFSTEKLYKSVKRNQYNAIFSFIRKLSRKLTIPKFSENRRIKRRNLSTCHLSKLHFELRNIKTNADLTPPCEDLKFIINVNWSSSYNILRLVRWNTIDPGDLRRNKDNFQHSTIFYCGFLRGVAFAYYLVDNSFLQESTSSVFLEFLTL